MARVISSQCPDAPEVLTRQGWISRTFEIQVVTPIFGGGVEVNTPDPVCCVRATSIRGHLRFWWRATRGAAFSDPARLREAEVEIFGDTDNPSNVDVSVRILASGQPKPSFKLPPGKSFPMAVDGHPAYALFPFQGNARENKSISKGIRGARFELRIAYPAADTLETTRSKINCERRHRGLAPLDWSVRDLNTEIWAALQSWVMLGGIGARTRRGCGALWCETVSPTSRDQVFAWFRKLALPNQALKWPVIDRSPLLGPESSAITAWRNAIEALRDFRQGVDHGRNSGHQHNQPRRSRWPEAETIRTVTRRRSPKHQRLQNIPDDAVPRAEFGLPIVFHFKDERDGEPFGTQLYPCLNEKEVGRMSSPLILKPLAINPSIALPLIVRLLTPPLQGAILKQGTREIAKFTRDSIARVQLGEYNNSPMAGHSNAVDAFIAFAKKRGFEEVKP